MTTKNFQFENIEINFIQIFTSVKKNYEKKCQRNIKHSIIRTLKQQKVDKYKVKREQVNLRTLNNLNLKIQVPSNNKVLNKK